MKAMEIYKGLNEISPIKKPKGTRRYTESPIRSYFSHIGDKIISKKSLNCVNMEEKTEPIPSCGNKTNDESKKVNLQNSIDILKYHLVSLPKNLNIQNDDSISNLESYSYLQKGKRKGHATGRNDLCQHNITDQAKMVSELSVEKKEKRISKYRKVEELKTERVNAPQVEIPSIDLKLGKSDNKALREFLVKLWPPKKQYKLVKPETHSEKDIQDPHFLQKVFGNLLSKSNLHLKSIEFPLETETDSKNSEKDPIKEVKQIMSLNKSKQLDSSIKESGKEEKSVLGDIAIVKKLKLRPRKQRNSKFISIRIVVIDAKTKREVLEELVNSMAESNEEKEKLSNIVEELVDIIKSDNGNLVIKQKEKLLDQSSDAPIANTLQLNKSPKHRQLRSLQTIQTPNEKTERKSNIGIPLQIKEIKLENVKKKRYIYKPLLDQAPRQLRNSTLAPTEFASTPLPIEDSGKPKIEVITLPLNDSVLSTAKNNTSDIQSEPAPEIPTSLPFINKKISMPHPKKKIPKTLIPQLNDLQLLASNPIFVSLRTYKSPKPGTSIKIIHTDYSHLQDHPINKCIHYINQFIANTFKNKEQNYNLKLIQQLGKALGLQLPREKILMDSQSFKNKDFAHPFKEKILKQLWTILNIENDMQNFEAKAPPYKFYVSQGNNGMLVKSILKERWWWSYGNKNDESINLCWTQWCKKSFIQSLQMKILQQKAEVPPDSNSKTQETIQMCNHLENQFHISNKKAMFINMQQFYIATKKDPFETLPLTFHIKFGASDPEFEKFTSYYNSLETKYQQYLTEKKEKKKVQDSEIKKPVVKNIWIVKPGENSNRGHGIQVLRDYEEIKKTINTQSTTQRTYIVQKYIESPLLIYRRKFDIRMYGMLTSINGLIKGYFYEEGYIRTSSKEFTLKNLANKTIHLTNDAVQAKTEDYGKYETGNKLSFGDFQKYLDLTYPDLNVDFYRDILIQIKVII